MVNGGVVRRQTIGIPMGTNCGPQLCNSFLYAYESRFIDRLVRLRGVLAARRCHMTFRLIDDVLSLDNLPWRDYVTRPAVGAEDSDGDTLGGVYPASLQLNETSVSTHEVHFVGVSIKDVRGALVLDVFDKRKSFPFRVVRYPTLASTIPTHLPYGVFTGQLVRYYTICSCRKAFVDWALNTASILLRQGCTRSRLLRAWRVFLSKRCPLRWRASQTGLCRQFKQGLGSSFGAHPVRIG